MQRIRVIPCLQLSEGSIVKTIRFNNPGYIGDPINTVRIFNEFEVDELCFLDIRASVENRMPDFSILKNIADECFMPLSYGGGVRDFETAKKILSIGFEKIVLNTCTFTSPSLVQKLVDYFGSQAIIGAIDVKRSIFSGYQPYVFSGKRRLPGNLIEWVQKIESLGVGELLVTSIDREGTWKGYDLALLEIVTNNVNIPVIANGGAGKVEHLASAVNIARVSAVAMGSMVIYQNKDMGVLINFPDSKKLGAGFE